MTGIETVALMNPIAAGVAGLIASLHCVGMCGPLGCSVLMVGGSERRAGGLVGYQFGRIVSYGVLGLLAGAFGGRVFGAFGGVSSRIVPLALVVAILLTLFRVDTKLARFSWMASMSRAVMKRALKTPQALRGLSLGLVTPLLPCGLLYSMIWVAAVSGSAINGGLIMSSFALGGAPALTASLFGWKRLSKHLSAGALFRWQRGIAWIAIAVLVGRSFLEFDVNALMGGEGFCLSIR